ncbi:hypothetical protein PV327_002946 [Microctonus hyperodae]|uniref:Reverse transcriptase Ty1/copia-type domain-containing protein n=1 Tax=Microctonus hyperodae TaxID=165561 RepID=A0AA39L0I2_MICHY|nr:hypothetical protein PV327_002946 [Microctonus hyperodae]
MKKQSQQEEVYEVIYDSGTEEIQNEIDNEEEDEIDRESSGSSMYNDAEENSDINNEIVNERYNLRRNRKPNTKYDDYEMDLDKILIATSVERDEPLCYDDAMASSDAKRWKQAMQAEIKALEENETWMIIGESEVKRAVIECKWVYKKKRDETGNISSYKARLVARGFQQIGSYNNDIYSPVAKLTSVRIFLAYCNNFNFKVNQLDVCSAFLNGDIDDDVYIVLPKGFDKNEGKFAKLKKSLYGLKPRLKNQRIIQQLSLVKISICW